MRSIALGSGFGVMLLLPVVMGCGPGQGKVSGRVLFNGAPLPGGRVTFRPADPKQNSVSAALDEQGNYQATLPAGEVMVSIDNRELEPRAPRSRTPLPDALSPEAKKLLGPAKPDKSQPKSAANTPEKRSSRYVKIPSKYHDAETSGLQFTVRPGNQPHDIELDR